MIVLVMTQILINIARSFLVDSEMEQIDFIDSCTGEEDEEDGRSRRGTDTVSLSSQFMAYIERRITREVSFTVNQMLTDQF